jgi:hypothetical protein
VAYNTTLTVPTVTGSHNDFSAVIVCNGTRNDLPSGAYNGANEILNGGGNLRAYTDSSKTTQLPVEIVSFVTGASPQIEVWIKLPAGNPMVTSATIYIEADTVATAQPAFTNEFGRNAVWGDERHRYHTTGGIDGSLPDSTGSGLALTNSGGLVSTADGWEIGADEYVEGSESGPTPTAFTLYAYMRVDALTDYGPGIGNAPYRGNWPNGQSHASVNGIVYAGTSAVSRIVTSAGVATTGTFELWALAFDATNGSEFSINGISKGTASYTGVEAISGIFAGGRDGSSLTLQQLGSSKIKRSLTCLATEYDNQSATTAWFTNDGWADSGGGLTISPPVIDSTNLFDISEVIVPPVIGLSPIDSTNLFDVSSVNHPELIELSPVDSANDIPSPTITMPQLINLDPIDSLNAFSIAGIAGGLIIRAGSLVSSSIRSGSFAPSRTASIQ